MTETRRNTIVGLTTLTGLLGLAWLIFVFGDVAGVVTHTYPIAINIDDASGLAQGSRIKLVGVDIGSIGDIQVQADPAEGVTLFCDIKHKYDIPENAIVNSATGPLGGSANININPAPYEPGDPVPSMLPKDGSATINATATSITRQLQELADSLTKDVKKQLENFGRLTEEITTLSREYTVVGKNINTMFEVQSPEDIESGKARPNINTIVARTDARIAELKVTLKHINDLIGDEQLRSDIRQTVANARDLTANANTFINEDAREFADRASGATDDLRQQIAQLSRRYSAVADDLTETLQTLNAALADARSGEGTVGKLIQDPALYDSLTDAAQRLSAAIKQATLLMEKWKAEGLPIQF
jgi:phospholipid/cholesterol/gamma-HCH transport system substrate-binding protein